VNRQGCGSTVLVVLFGLPCLKPVRMVEALPHLSELPLAKHAEDAHGGLQIAIGRDGSEPNMHEQLSETRASTPKVSKKTTPGGCCAGGPGFPLFPCLPSHAVVHSLPREIQDTGRIIVSTTNPPADHIQ